MPRTSFFLLFLAQALLVASQQYCIVGGGPGGVQMAYFLKNSGRSYVLFEKNDEAGSFFKTFPRHRKLISINKIYTGTSNKVYNERHDWNSLLNNEVYFRDYSKEFWAPADDLVRYLNAFVEHHGINVVYNTRITEVRKDKSVFVLKDQNGMTYKCDIPIIATGVANMTWPKNVGGQDIVEHYDTVSTNPEDFTNQTVAILGKGNSGFETAQALMEHTAYVHMMGGRNRLRLAWETHYVGDIRAVNNGILDTYQLKSQDAIYEGPMEDLDFVKKGNKIFVVLKDNANIENLPSREGFDRVINCLGFKFDNSIFTEDTQPAMNTRGKHPILTHSYESSTVPGLYFAGTIMHSRDFRKSAGGFIHGFRYLVRALHHILEEKHHAQPWPAVTLEPTTQTVGKHLMKRADEGAGIYQMFEILCDVVLLESNEPAKYYEEVPVARLFQMFQGKRILTLTMEYGKNFSGPGKDVFRLDRAQGDRDNAHNSNFLHPVIRHFDLGKSKKYLQKIHLLEDILTQFSLPETHAAPLFEFLNLYVFPKTESSAKRGQSSEDVGKSANDDIDAEASHPDFPVVVSPEAFIRAKLARHHAQHEHQHEVESQPGVLAKQLEEDANQSEEDWAKRVALSNKREAARPTTSNRRDQSRGFGSKPGKKLRDSFQKKRKKHKKKLKKQLKIASDGDYRHSDEAQLTDREADRQRELGLLGQVLPDGDEDEGTLLRQDGGEFIDDGEASSSEPMTITDILKEAEPLVIDGDDTRQASRVVSSRQFTTQTDPAKLVLAAALLILAAAIVYASRSNTASSASKEKV